MSQTNDTTPDESAQPDASDTNELETATTPADNEIDLPTPDETETDAPADDAVETAEDVEETDADESDAGSSPAAEAELAEIAASVEALLFASEAPLPPAKIASAAEVPPRLIKKAVAMLNEKYESMGTSFRIDSIAGGYQMLTRPEYNDVLVRMLTVKKNSRLSQAALETLAIVAYRQPILRADIEVIRGVACGEVLRSLMERNLVKIVGRAEVIGRPMLYGTTKHFLEIFGLSSLDDLPRGDELRGKTEPPKPAKSKAKAESDESEETDEETLTASDESEATEDVEDLDEEEFEDEDFDDEDDEDFEDEEDEFDDEDDEFEDDDEDEDDD